MENCFPISDFERLIQEDFFPQTHPRCNLKKSIYVMAAINIFEKPHFRETQSFFCNLPSVRKLKTFDRLKVKYF